MIEGIRNYISDLEFRFTIYKDKIHIINYQKIITLELDKIIFIGNNKKIIIKGKNLVLNKMLEEEVLIYGEVLQIEVEDE